MSMWDTASAGVTAISAACITFASGVLGMIIRSVVPDRIMSPAAVNVLKLINGFIATMAALVLGLLINSANNLANTQKAGLESLSAKALQLDQALDQYGPEAKSVREILKSTMIHSYEQIWGQRHAETAPLRVGQTSATIQSINSFLATLRPTTELQRRILAMSFDTVASLAEARELMSVQVAGTVSSPFVAILISWVSLLFVGFGMLGRINLAVTSGMVVGAFAIGSAVFLILELGQPYTGVAGLSPAPLLQVIESVDR